MNSGLFADRFYSTVKFVQLFVCITGKEKQSGVEKKQGKFYDANSKAESKSNDKERKKNTKSKQEVFSQMDNTKTQKQFVPKNKGKHKKQVPVSKGKSKDISKNENKDTTKKKTKHKKKHKKLSAKRKQELLRRVTLDEFGPLTEFDFSEESTEVEPNKQIVEEVSHLVYFTLYLYFIL